MTLVDAVGTTGTLLVVLAYLGTQLRALDAGWRIAVALAPSPVPPGVDTPEDLARAERLHASMQAARG